MSRWFDMLNGAVSLDVQNVRIVQNVVPQGIFEQFEHSEQPIMAGYGEDHERAAIPQYDGRIPVEWVEGFAKLQTMPPPGDMPPKSWEQVINDAGLFLDRWATQATALGWTTLDVFGIHHSKPYGGLQCAGLVALISGNTVTAITADICSIRHSNAVINRYYRRAAQPGQIPLWELCGKGMANDA